MKQLRIFDDPINLMALSVKNANIPHGKLRPFINWVGGKTKLLPQLLPLMPDKFATYYEPFVGGGGVFWGLAGQGKITRAVLSDIIPDLIFAWNAVKYNPLAVESHLNGHIKHDSRGYFYMIADKQMDDPLEIGARLIYLATKSYRSRITYNGHRIFIHGYAGNRNIPKDKWKGILQPCSLALQNVEIGLVQTHVPAVTGDLVYFDPPYIYSEANYGKKWTLQNYESIRAQCDRLTQNGVHIRLSSRDIPEIREIFSKYTIYPIVSQSNMANKLGYTKMSEVLISN